MTKYEHKHDWCFLMVFKTSTELEPSPNGVTHSKKCRECGKVFLYKAGKVWNEQQKSFALGLDFVKGYTHEDPADSNPTILYK